MQAYDAQRGSSTERGYGGKWRLYSRARLRKHPNCVHCGKVATITNHIRSAKQFPELFWDKSNHESVCVGCNNRIAIAREGGFGR
jgi:5-methylcytosine-specific restriction protein A